MDLDDLIDQINDALSEIEDAEIALSKGDTRKATNIARSVERARDDLGDMLDSYQRGVRAAAKELAELDREMNRLMSEL